MVNIIGGLESITEQQFEKQYHTFKKSQIGQMVIELDEKIELPRDCVLHILDNLTRNDTSDTPLITQNIFLNNTQRKSFIYHNTIPINKTDKKLFNRDKFVFRTNGLNKDLDHFTKQYRDFIQRSNDTDNLFNKTNVETVVNHNPMWRIRVIGKLAAYRRFKAIFKSIIKSILSVPRGKNQLLEINLSNELYTRDNFIAILNKKEGTDLVKYERDMSFYFLLNLYAYIYPKTKIESIFNLIPMAMLDRITLMLTANNKAIFLKLSNLQEMASKGSNLLQNFMDYINELKLTNSELEETFDIDTHIKLKEIVRDATIGVDEDDAGLGETDPDIIMQNRIDKAAERISNMPPEEAINKRLLVQYEKEAEQYINNLPNKTPAQKQRLIKRAQKYKDIKIGDKTIKEILSEPVDNEIVGKYLDFLEDKVEDKSMLKLTTTEMASEYMEKTFTYDLALVASSFNKNGLFLIDIKEDESIDELNGYRVFKLQFETEDGEVGTSKVTMPIIDEDGVFKINGIRNRMKPQMINVPIVKLSSKRVSLAASYKTLIERNVSKAHSFDDYIVTLITKINKENKVIKTTMGRREYSLKLPYEYTQLAKKFETIKIDALTINSNFDHRLELNKKQDIDISVLEKEYGVFCGKIGNNDYLFMGLDNQIAVYDTKEKEIKDYTTITELIYDYSNTNVKVPIVSEWTDLKIFDKKFPIVFVLGYKYGLTETLKHINIDYRIVEKGKRIDKSPTEIVIKFKDKNIVFDRYPLVKSLILSGLLKYNTKDYELEEFNDKNTYYNLLSDKGISTNYIVGIDTFFDTFLDPLTIRFLDQMNEPTNLRDLLIRATQMLSTEEFIPPSSIKNHRIRSYDRMNAILYDEIARTHAIYKNKKGKKGKFTINPEAVMQRIIQDNAVITVEEINPMNDLKDKTSFTYTGVGGRTAQSFVLTDRQFPHDGVGIISEAVPDSPKVGISGHTPPNANIINLSGMLQTTQDPNTLGAGQLLDTTALFQPGSDSDDAKRRNFSSIQISHRVPCKNGETGRYCTGYEYVIPHACDKTFTAIARKDGSVEEINEKLQLATIRYKDGTKDIVDYSTKQGSVSGIYLEQTMELNIKLGDKIKRGDVLAYNPGWFQKDDDPKSKQVMAKHGVYGNIALLECNFSIEDSCGLTAEYSQLLGMRPTHIRPLDITKDTVIHEIRKVADHVKNTDHICIMEDEAIMDLSIANNEDSHDFLLETNTNAPKARHTGTISKIEVFHSCPIEEMTPSLAKFVKTITQDKKRKHLLAKEKGLELQYPAPKVVPKGTKLKGIEFGSDTVAIFFYITEDIDCVAGDKVVFDTSLKSVTSTVFDYELYTESGVKVDGIFGCMSPMHRKVTSPFKQGFLQRIFEDADQMILNL